MLSKHLSIYSCNKGGCISPWSINKQLKHYFVSVFKIPLKGCGHQNIDQVKKLINRSIFVQINSNILSSKWLLSNAFKNVDSTTKASFST